MCVQFNEFSLFILFIVNNGQADGKFKLIGYAQIQNLPLLNNIADAFNGSRSLNLSLRLHQHSYSILWSLRGDPVFILRLVVAFVAQLCNKYQTSRV